MTAKMHLPLFETATTPFVRTSAGAWTRVQQRVQPEQFEPAHDTPELYMESRHIVHVSDGINSLTIDKLTFRIR